MHWRISKPRISSPGQAATWMRCTCSPCGKVVVKPFADAVDGSQIVGCGAHPRIASDKRAANKSRGCPCIEQDSAAPWRIWNGATKKKDAAVLPIIKISEVGNLGSHVGHVRSTIHAFAPLPFCCLLHTSICMCAQQWKWLHGIGLAVLGGSASCFSTAATRLHVPSPMRSRDRCNPAEICMLYILGYGVREDCCICPRGVDWTK